jgi:hypothetical protein
VQAQSVFENLQVKDVWLSWAEDPDNPLARELRLRREEALNALRVALPRLNVLGSRYMQRVSSVLSFFGPELGADSRPSTGNRCALRASIPCMIIKSFLPRNCSQQTVVRRCRRLPILFRLRR